MREGNDVLERVFVTLLNMSITASFVIIAIIFLRLFLKRAPKWISCALWALVAVRLIVPVLPESTFSLIPSGKVVTTDILISQHPTIKTGLPVVNDYVNPLISGSMAPEIGNSVNPLQAVMFIAGIIWIAGVAVMLVYSFITCMKLRRRVFAAMLVRDNVWKCDAVDSPFVLGVIKPKIYIPFGIAEEDIEYVIAHERAHIKRRDNLIKPIGFLLLAVYWFNPLCWVAFILLCRDIEMACDEKVFGEIGFDEKKAYSKALLSCAVSRRDIYMCPLAFGEIGVKQRIKNALSYKKPAFWIIIVAVMVSLTAGAALLLNPPGSSNDGKNAQNLSNKSTNTLTLNKMTVYLSENDSYLIMEILSGQKYAKGSGVSDSCDYVFAVYDNIGKAVLEDYYIDSKTGEVWLVTKGNNQKCLIPQSQLFELLGIFRHSDFSISNTDLVLGRYSPTGVVYLSPLSSDTPDAFFKGSEDTKITISADKFGLSTDKASVSYYSKNISFNNPRYVLTYPENYIRAFDSKGLSDIDISSYKSKRCYLVLAEDGTDTGYRIFCLDENVWVGHWGWYGTNKDAFWCEYIFNVRLG